MERRIVLATTSLAVSAASGTYGGTATFVAHLTSGGTDVAGATVDLHLGSVDLGNTLTDANGLATINNVSLAGLNVGTYVGLVVADYAGDSSFSASSGSASLTVTPAPLTITANNQTKVYGAALPTLTASYIGFVNGDTAASLSTLPTIATTATASSHVAPGPYSISASGAVDSNYTISYVAGSLNVATAPLTITAGNQTKVYGAALPTLTASYTGFVNGDTAANLNTPPTISTTATSASHVVGSPYAITASGAANSDYAISYVAGSLSITAAPLTITANNQAKVYGAALPALTASFTGFVNGDTALSLVLQPTVMTTATAASHVAGSPYAVNASGALDPDYSISYVDGLLSVIPAPLTITASNPTKIYGAALPPLSVSYIGFVNGDTAASLTTQPTITTTATIASHVAGNPYAVNASAAVDVDYAISYVDGSLTVTPTPLTITADNKTKVYGGTLPTLTASYIGFVNGDTAASLTTQPTLTTTATSASHVAGSPYAINASAAVDADYAISYIDGSLSVSVAPLTIVANDQTKVYGAAVPTLNASFIGLVNGDTAASLTTPPGLATTANASSNVSGSPYAITASGAVGSDYSISYTSGALSVTRAPLTITVADKTKVYGQDNPSLTGTITGIVNDDKVEALYSTMATAASGVVNGGYVITATGLKGLVTGNYTIANIIPGTLSITPAALTVKANDAVKTFIGPIPTFSATYSGFVNGDTSASLTTPVSLSTTATSTSASGSYPISVSGGISANYSVTKVSGTLQIQAPLTPSYDPGLVAYVTSLYRDLIGRDPGAFGYAHWNTAFTQGTTRVSVARQIFTSSEATAYRLAHRGSTVSLYRAFTHALLAQRLAARA